MSGKIKPGLLKTGAKKDYKTPGWRFDKKYTIQTMEHHVQILEWLDLP